MLILATAMSERAAGMCSWGSDQAFGASHTCDTLQPLNPCSKIQPPRLQSAPPPTPRVVRFNPNPSLATIPVRFIGGTTYNTTSDENSHLTCKRHHMQLIDLGVGIHS